MSSHAPRRQLRKGPWAFDVSEPCPDPLHERGQAAGWEGPAIVGLTAALVSFGLISLHGASSAHAISAGLPHYHYAALQALGVGVGLVAMAACAHVPTRWWGRMSHPLLVLSVLLLVVVILPFTEGIAPRVNGRRRWLQLGVQFQVSDLAKLAVVVWTASLAVRKRVHFRRLGRGLAPILVGLGVVVLLVGMEDNSTAMIIAALGAAIVFTAGARIGHLALLGALAAPLVGLRLSTGNAGSRWAWIWIDPDDPSEVLNSQAGQGHVAVGTGGVTGVGVGQGHQEHWIPEAHTDFTFAIIAEEWGFLGSMLLIACFLALVAIGFKVAHNARNLFGRLVAVGIASLIGLQAFLHVGVNVGAVPTTGLSLPFISYGRTNLVAMLAAVGMLLGVAREAAPRPRDAPAPAGG